MSKVKSLPNWAIWLEMPTLKARDAVALSYGINPFAYETKGSLWAQNSINGFEERLMLYCACHKNPISPVQLSQWAQSMGWNIPVELAALAPVPVATTEPLPIEQVHEALAGVIYAGVDVDDLHSELVRMGVTFTMRDDGVATIQTPDGTINGRRMPLSSLYSELSSLYYAAPTDCKLGSLIRGSGASGGGATGNSNYCPKTAPNITPATISPQVKGRRNTQVAAIIQQATDFNYPPKSIPYGGKAKIQTECLKNKNLFTVDAFKHAWKVAIRRELIEVENVDKYRKPA